MSDAQKILFTGGSGRLGKACRKVIPGAQYPGRRDLDVLDAASIDAWLTAHSPKVVVHMAAAAGIPWCEQNRAKAYELNVGGSRRMLNASATHGVEHFILLSTACVFPGTDPDAMEDEDSLPYPKHYYGVTKYVAEELTRSAAAPKMLTTIVRTNFTAMPWEHPGAFVDRFGTYLFAQGVAQGLLDIIGERPAHPIIHVCGERKLSMYEYARLGGSDVHEMTLADYSGPELTVNMSLSTRYWRPYRIEDADYRDD